MHGPWPLAWGRGEVSVRGATLEVRVGRKRHVLDLDAVTPRLARWSYSRSMAVGAAVLLGDVSVAGAYTPRGVHFDGCVRTPTAIVGPDHLAELIAALGDRIAVRELDPGEASRFHLVPRMSRVAVLSVLAIPGLASVALIQAAIESQHLVIATGAAGGLVAVLAGARWVISHTRPIEIVVDNDHVAVDGVTAPRASVRSARGHTIVRSRFASASFEAIALEAPSRRIIVQSMEGTAKPRGARLGGAVYMVPADDFDRLAGALGVD